MKSFNKFVIIIIIVVLHCQYEFSGGSSNSPCGTNRISESCIVCFSKTRRTCFQMCRLNLTNIIFLKSTEKSRTFYIPTINIHTYSTIFFFMFFHIGLYNSAYYLFATSRVKDEKCPRRSNSAENIRINTCLQYQQVLCNNIIIYIIYMRTDTTCRIIIIILCIYY